MHATPDAAHWHAQDDDAEVCVDERVDPRGEDAYWSAAYRAEPYYRPGLDYEDYAPAYCVGYIGFAQYGGSFPDAERSLCANWVRIRGASRLDMEEACAAMRAAWRHAEAVLSETVEVRSRAQRRPLPATRPQPASSPADLSLQPA